MKRKNGSHAIIVFIDSYLPWTLAQIFSTTTTTRIWSWLDCRDWIRFSSYYWMTIHWFTLETTKQSCKRCSDFAYEFLNHACWFRIIHYSWFYWFASIYCSVSGLFLLYVSLFFTTFAPMFLYASYTVVFNIPVFVYSVCVSLSECCPLICRRYHFCCCCCCFCVRNLKYG